LPSNCRCSVLRQRRLRGMKSGSRRQG
jgi:hypothetical protein